MRDIGKLISSQRKKMKLSQVMLAELLYKEGIHITVKGISKWETNATEPSITTFFSICKILKITNIYEAYFGVNPSDPLSSLNEEGKETLQLTENIIPDHANYGVKISGDSMEPEFEHGQIAWVLKQNVVMNGEIGIFYLNGEAYIKKLQNDTKGTFLISLNEKYPPIPITEHDRFDILGKVVGKNHPDDLQKVTVQ